MTAVADTLMPQVRCGACDRPHPPGNWFCPGCGAPSNGAAVPAPAAAAPRSREEGRAATPARGGGRLWVDALIVLLMALSAILALFGPPLEAAQWRPDLLRARYTGGRLPGDLPAAEAGGSLPAPPAPPPPVAPPPVPPRPVVPRPAAPPGFGPVTVWPELAPSAAGFIWATQGWITQEYGCTDFPLEPWSAEFDCLFHHGIDVGNLPRTPVLAARDGEVTWAGWKDDGYGYSVLIDHGDGIVSRYAHLCCRPSVIAGQRVKRGDPIGLMGSTGASSGSHLHFAVEVDGRDVDPRTVLPPEQ